MGSAESAAWFGAWAQFGAAIATSAAVIVALGVAIRDGRMARSERRDREAAQARNVFVSTELSFTLAAVASHGTVVCDLVLTNWSDSTLLSVDPVDVFLPDRPERQQWSDALMGDSASDQSPHDRVRPTGEWRAKVSLLVEDSGALAVGDSVRPSVTFRYTDAAGLVWERTDNDQPYRVYMNQPQERRARDNRGRQLDFAEPEGPRTGRGYRARRWLHARWRRARPR